MVLRTRRQMESRQLNSHTIDSIFENYWFGRPDRRDFLQAAKEWVVVRILFWGRPLCGEGYNHQMEVDDLSSALIQDAEGKHLKGAERSVVWRDIMSVKSWHDSKPQYSNRLARLVHDRLVAEAIEQLKAEGTLYRSMDSHTTVWILSPSASARFIQQRNEPRRKRRAA